MVTDVSVIDTRIVTRCPSPGVVFVIVIGGLAQVGMIEVQPPRLLVMIGRFMHVRRTGNEAERQVGDTTAEGEDPAHPPESS